MSDKTKIEWSDATINAINGCDVVSPGCKHCYAMKQAHRFPVRQGLTMKTAGGMVWTGEVRFHEPALRQVLAWKRPRKIFWNAHGDTFHDKVPDEWIDSCFAVMAMTPQHIHQVLTKRPDRMRDYILARTSLSVWHARLWHRFHELGGEWENCPVMPLPNVWLGVSVEDQERADQRIPILIDTPAAIRWLSMEPLLGPVDIRHDLGLPPVMHGSMIDWVVVGGESGPRARPMHPAWERGIREQCQAAGVPYLFKQWGEWARWEPRHPADPVIYLAENGTRFTNPGLDREPMVQVGKKAAGRAIGGIEYDGYPA